MHSNTGTRVVFDHTRSNYFCSTGFVELQLRTCRFSSVDYSSMIQRIHTSNSMADAVNLIRKYCWWNINWLLCELNSDHNSITVFSAFRSLIYDRGCWNSCTIGQFLLYQSGHAHFEPLKYFYLWVQEIYQANRLKVMITLHEKIIPFDVFIWKKGDDEELVMCEPEFACLTSLCLFFSFFQVNSQLVISLCLWWLEFQWIGLCVIALHVRVDMFLKFNALQIKLIVGRLFSQHTHSTYNFA